MNAESSALELRKAGYSVHHRQGVWWWRTLPGFCKPVDQFQAFPGLSAQPRWRDSFVGYSHAVSAGDESNHVWYPMLLTGEKLRAFQIGDLKPRKRSIVRKALRELAVRRLETIDPYMEDINAVCISFAERTGYGKPPSHFKQQRAEWESLLRRQFAMGGREYWGAFAGDRLVAYYVAVSIEGTVYIGTAKSHTDALGVYPNDALAFRFLEHCRELPECRQVVFGDWTADVPSLNAFKEQYGFVKTAVPIFRRERAAFRLAVLARRVWQRRKESAPVPSAEGAGGGGERTDGSSGGPPGGPAAGEPADRTGSQQ